MLDKAGKVKAAIAKIPKHKKEDAAKTTQILMKLIEDAEAVKKQKMEVNLCSKNPF